MALPEYATKPETEEGDAKAKPVLDFETWLADESAQIKRIVSDGVKTVLDLPLKKKMRYCFINLSDAQRDAIPSVNALVEAWKLSVGEEPHRVVTYDEVNNAFHGEKRPTSLITATWINAHLRHKTFKKSDIGQELAKVGLSNGLPDNSVVPSLRIASPFILNHLFKQVKVSKKLLDEIYQDFGVDGSEIVHDLRTLDSVGKNVENSAFRITTPTAELFRKCTICLFSKTQKEHLVPELDKLFPMEVSWRYRRKRKKGARRNVSYDIVNHKPRNPVLHPDDGNLLSL
jgi:hypothetical protein